ncbi:MAG: hypothetical protein QOJ40_263 [Verrucomicrobiota bacterium]
MHLLSDGTVMVENNNDGSLYGPTWYLLTPDSAGHYANGTWTTLRSMNDTRLFFASQLLKDGRLFVAGGEYGTGTSAAEIYDPLVNTWTSLPNPGHRFSDANSEILSDGRVLVALVETDLRHTLIYDPGANTWSAGPTCNGIHNESAWVKLPDDSILMVDRLSTSAERYIPSLNQWVIDATVPVSLYDPYGDETGPGLLLPNGNVIYFGATGQTAIYTPSGTSAPGAWVAGPDLPDGQGMPDAPSAMLPNGKILIATAPIPISGNVFQSPTSFYEYDYVLNSFTRVSPPGGGATEGGSSFQRNMLMLPEGKVLSSRFSNQLYIYTPDGTPISSAKPVISSVSQNLDGSFHLTGTQLNGISEGACYGDDDQAASNYPLVRLTSGSGNVYYARTYNWSSTSVMTGNRPVATEFSLPAGLPAANYSLVVVANGNSSDPVPFSALPQPPVITVQPVSQTIPAGNSVTFSVGGTGTAPLSYSWQRNSAFIAGATNPSYTTNNVQLADSGNQFRCVVTNVAGSATSSVAVLQVVVSNDQCAGALPVTGLTFSAALSTSNATSTGDPAPACVPGFGNGVWYRYTPAAPGQLELDTFGSDFDTGLGLYTGSCGALTQVACNDDSGGSQSQIVLPVSAGTTYYILAGGHGANTGNLLFHLALSPNLDHFIWNTVPSPQSANVPFTVTVSAKDVLGNGFTNFAGSVVLSATAAGGIGTNRLVDGLSSTGSATGTFTYGYPFTPTNNLTVTHASSFFGSKVSLWTGAGVLLATQAVAGPNGVWTETPLSVPLSLAAGSNYVVAVRVSSSTYYWLTSLSGAFADGTIGTALFTTADAFPTGTSAGFWPLVGLRYSVGVPQSIAITPTNSAPFINGIWTGNLSVLQAGTNVVLRANDGAGHSGLSNPFQTVGLPTLDHFAWSPVSPPAGTNVPFMVTITAQSSNNVTIPGFVGPVNLTATGGSPLGPVAISPPRSAWFLNGVWTGSLIVLQTANNVVLVAADDAGHTGSSNPFVVASPNVAPYQININGISRGQDGQLQLTISGWPGDVYRVLASTDLLDWKTIATITNLTGIVQFTDPEAAIYDQRFYRCITP